MSHQAIHPDWDVMKELYDAKGGRSGVTENRIMRLAFHDCVRYTGENMIIQYKFWALSGAQ